MVGFDVASGKEKAAEDEAVQSSQNVIVHMIVLESGL